MGRLSGGVGGWRSFQGQADFLGPLFTQAMVPWRPGREVFTERAGLLGWGCGLGWRVGTWRRHVLCPVLMACGVSVLQRSFSAHRAVGGPGS